MMNATEAPARCPSTLLEGLNPEQIEVVQHHEGPLVVTAVAGCGKTTALVRRIAYLIQAYNVDPASILAVTFSKKAADEMNERLEGFGVHDARVGTWHSLAFEILKREEPGFREWEIDTRDRYRTIIKVACGFRGMDWKTYDLTTVLSYIGACKGRCAKPGSDRAIEIAQAVYDARPCAQTNPELLFEAYERAERERCQRRILTFDDMLLEAWEILSTDENARVRWASRYDFVMQDEAQDENEVQARLGEMLARDHRNYMVVGDPAQSIYAFRGAEPRRFIAFEKEWNARKIAMMRNYRSGVEIIDAANGVIRAMAPGSHMGVEMVCERATSADVAMISSADPEEEAAAIADDVASLIEDGVSPADCAVLYRTNSQSRALEEAFLSRRIPYVVLGGVQFWDRKEVKGLIAYLRCADGRATFDDFKKCINAPFRYLGAAFVERVECEDTGEHGFDWTEATIRLADGAGGLQRRQRTSAHEWAGIVRTIRKSIEIRDSLGPLHEIVIHDEGEQHAAKPHMPAALIETIIRDTRYLEWLTRDEGAETVENNRISNVRELVRVAEKFTTVRDFLDFIDESIDAAARAKSEDAPDRVILCSLHRSKGLEWPAVFIAGVSERVLPHPRAEDLDEERRLFYVGVTRAKDRLRVSHTGNVATGTGTRPVSPSRFINEAAIGGAA